jgi:H+/Cl- antiporter ClcA
VVQGTSTWAQLRLVLLAAAIGIPAALLAAAFLDLVHLVEHWLWEDLPAALGRSAPPWYLVLGLPVAGAVVVLVARELLPGDGGHSPLTGLHGAPIAVRHAPGVALAALGTLSFGAVLGPEAPLIALGSAVGAVMVSLARLGPREAGMLRSAGEFSAISALFGGPLVAGFLLIEGGVALGAALIPALLPGLVAAAVGYLVFVGLGDWGGLQAAALAVPGLPGYHGTSVRDLLVAVVIGVVTAGLVAPAFRFAVGVEAVSRRLGKPVSLLGGGALVGAVALAALALDVDPESVLFSGQAALPALVTESSLAVIVLLLVAKALAYSICLGCGFRGGPIFPAIFLGVAAAMVPTTLFGLSPTLAVAIGAAAGMAAATRLLFSPVLLAALLVGSSGMDAVPAAVLASVAAWLTVTAMAGRTAGDGRAPGPH